jgi:N-acetylglutamate synthase-like GNAT family acetyltransferase
MVPESQHAQRMAPFSEKGFYLAEFRGRTLMLAVPPEQLGDPEAFERVLAELAANATRVVLISSGPEIFEAIHATPMLSADSPRLEGGIWHALRSSGRVGVDTGDAKTFAAATVAIALRLGVSKLVWIDRSGGLHDRDGRRLSFVHRDELKAHLAAPPDPEDRRNSLLRETEKALDAGLHAINMCSAAGLADELFTYAGSGTLFTLDRYVEVRRLGIDDYDAADDLIGRGVDEGYLTPRSSSEIERVLTNGFGAFVEGHHLAGIGALLRWSEEPIGEIASLYTLTRFLGEGIGAHLIEAACVRAAELGCTSVVAVTTSERVAGFFEHHGFERVGEAEIPAKKWRGYDPERRSRALCVRRGFGPIS